MKNVFIIAEAGVNHNGNYILAKKLIDVASEAGADAIKFQIFNSEKLVTKNTPKADYQQNHSDKKETQLEMLKKLELKKEDYKNLKDYCLEKNIKFMVTPFDEESLEFLKHLNIDTLKIPSGEITNLPFLEKISENFNNIILSTGMSTIDEIKDAVDVLKKGTSKKEITILHCNTEYPTPMHDANLNVIKTLKESFDLNIGYSDHTLGIEAPIAAVALGANVVEKHFTLDKDFEGPDHKASLNPTELFDMIKAIRNIEKALGDGVKKVTDSEKKNLKIARKSIVANLNIKEGEIFSKDNITTKRPGNGISPMKYYEILGKKATKNYFKDDIILEGDCD